MLAAHSPLITPTLSYERAWSKRGVKAEPPTARL